MTPLHVLVVDDEKNIRTTLCSCLEAAGCRALAVATGESALTAVERDSFDIAFLDLRLGSDRGMDLIPKLLSARPGLSIVVITAYSTVESAVEAIKLGAVEYLPKPFTPSQIRHLIAEIARRRALKERVAEVESRLASEVPEADLTTGSPKLRAVLDTLSRAAVADAPILLRGENGTGKGVLARALHAQSPRSARPFVPVNCPTLSEDLLASELFGHAQGAFTGAVRDQAGRVEVAEGGTLFLDEIGEISPALQAKLLRFVQEKQFERVGETRTRRADVRLVAASNRDLERDVTEGRFRPRTSSRWAEGFSHSSRELPAGSLPTFRQRPRRPCSAIGGRATCASCATPWSAPPSCGRSASSPPRPCPRPSRRTPAADFLGSGVTSRSRR